jgi:phage terminase small subunit
MPSDRQERFVREYLKDANATQAAIRAGYNRAGAGVEGNRLLKNPNVRKMLEAGQKKLAQRYEVTAERIQNAIAHQSFYNAKDYLRPDGSFKAITELTREEAAAITEFTVDTVTARDGTALLRTKVKFADKLQALTTLAKITGMMAPEGPAPASVVFVVEKSAPRRLAAHDDDE